MPPKRGEGTAKTLSERMEKQLPSAMFSRYGYPDAWDTRTFAVHFTPKEWREIIPKLKALEESSPSALIAAVEAMKSAVDGSKWGWRMKVEAYNDVLNLLRSPPTEAAER